MSEGTPSKLLPRVVEPRKMAHFGAEYQGTLPGDEMSRLAEAVDSIVCLSAKLLFGVDEQGRKTLTGNVGGVVTIECQRCMEPLEYPLSAQVNLAIVWDENEAKSLPRDIDPWIVEEAEAELYSIVEEELLLALPIVAYHEYACIDRGLAFPHNGAVPVVEETNNPFKVLAKLKKDQPPGEGN